MRKIILSLLIIVLGLNTYAQDNYSQLPTFPEPNAASLGEYGDIPVSHHTGVPNISIPIFTLQEGSLSMPISMSYHSSGVKVDEMASWVGLGWSLNAGGMISRSVNGAPDEGIKRTGAHTDKNGWGYYSDGGVPYEIESNCGNSDYNCRSYVEGECPAGDCDCVNCPNPSFTVYDYHKDAASGYIDLEPDVYTYNFLGQSGKFIFDENGEVVQIPKGDLKIEVDYTTVTIGTITHGKFNSWTITDTNGTKYYFGGANATEDLHNAQGPSGLNRDNYSTSSWYLYKVESSNGSDVINLTYEDEEYYYGNRTGQSFQRPWDNGSSGGSWKYIGNLTVANGPLNYTYVKGKRLSSISGTTGNYTVTFNEKSTGRSDLKHSTTSGVEPKALESIEVNSVYGVCKKFNLNTSYFYSTNDAGIGHYGTEDRYRLKLNSIQEVSCDNTLMIPAHSFTYNETVTMGRRHSLGRDHWGYYNGVDSQTSLLPDGMTNPNGSAFNGGSDREPDETKMKAWILTQIDYPTGGYTTFDYEAHRESSTSPIVGGLRIKSIKSYVDGGIATQKDYTYANGNLYAGTPSYFYDQDNNPDKSIVISPADIHWIYTSTPKPALSTTQGYHIGYSVIDEVNQDGSYSKYRYANLTPALGPQYNPFPPPTYTAGAGNLVKDEQYDDNSNVISHNSHIYDNDDDQTHYYGTRITLMTYYGSHPDTDYTLKNTYFHLVGRSRLVSTENFKDGVTTTSSYTYGNDHNNPLTQSTTFSDGTVSTTAFEYVHDYASIAPHNEMLTRNIISTPIKELSYGDNQLLSKVERNFTEYTSNQIVLGSIDVFADGINSVKYSYQYDAEDNIIESARQNDYATAIVWKNDRNSVAIFPSAQDNEVYYNSFEETGTVTPSKTGSKCRNSGSFNFSTNGSFTPPAGVTMVMSYWYYESNTWKYSGEVPFSNTISKGTKLDEIRAYPANSQPTSYILGFGMQPLSVCDPNGVVRTFEYDKLGRLLGTKDQDGNITSINQYNFK
ncbi:MAG: hypothetical protein NXI20_07230 [bacterium]|nr:hypothetical protein [bacterium]